MKNLEFVLRTWGKPNIINRWYWWSTLYRVFVHTCYFINRCCTVARFSVIQCNTHNRTLKSSTTSCKINSSLYIDLNMSRDMKMNILSPSHIICQSEIPRAPRLIVECRYVQWMNTILILEQKRWLAKETSSLSE